jgi:hypothetical protein
MPEGLDFHNHFTTFHKLGENPYLIINKLRE